MKKSLLCYALVILFSSVLFSCSKDDDDQANSESARYYVKYQVDFSTKFMLEDCVMKFATENGIQTITLNQQTFTPSWEGTYGPVDKNFTASIECSVPNLREYSIHAKIHVCREKEPFVIKAENESNRKPLSLQYKIDF